MADFGLACLSHNSTHKVKQTSGTIGYACPFYVQRRVITEGSEVYSFGIVMLELLTASPPAHVTTGEDGSQQYQFLVTHLNGDIRVAMLDVLSWKVEASLCSFAFLLSWLLSLYHYRTITKALLTAMVQ